MVKTSSLLFAIFSGMFFLLLVWFATKGFPSGTWSENLELINSTWGQLNSYSTIWKLEFLVVFGLAWVAFNLGKTSVWWNIVAVAHLFMLTEYALMVAGYPAVTTEEGFNLVNEMANWVFIACNMLWTLGIAGVYWQEKGILKYIGVSLTLLVFVVFLLLFFELASKSQILPIAMPAALVLLLLNVYLGLTIYKRTSE